MQSIQTNIKTRRRATINRTNLILDLIFVMMMMIWTTIFIVVCTLLFSTVHTSDPCRFEYPGKGVIDITSLGRTDGKAAYADRVPSTGTNYSMLGLLLFYVLI